MGFDDAPIWPSKRKGNTPEEITAGKAPVVNGQAE